MRWMRWAAMVLVVAAGAVLPASASAAVLAPPGHPGTNQYFETIPTSSGQAAPPGSVQGSGRTHPGSHALAGLGTGQATDSKLAKLGKQGQAAAALAASTAPVPASGAAATAARSGESSGGSDGSIGSGLSHALTSSSAGGLGIALPLLLVTALILALGVAGTAVWRGARGARSA